MNPLPDSPVEVIISRKGRSYVRDLRSLPVKRLRIIQLVNKVRDASVRFDMAKFARQTGWITDGRFLMRMTPEIRKGLSVLKSVRGSRIMHKDSYQAMLNLPLEKDPAFSVGIRSMGEGYPPRYLLQSPGSECVASADYVDMILHYYPQASIYISTRPSRHICDESPITFKAKNKVVAVLMPCED